jgi:glycerophosphoryl diester phosphodiesterase
LPDHTSAVPAARFAFLDWPAPIAFAHQGGAAEFPGNTMKAFQGAVNLGYKYLETDLQVTSDGVLVTFHNDTLDETTDHSGTISQLPWSVVKEARVGGTEPIARFDDVVTTFGEMRFNIEPKTDQSVGPFIEAVKRMRLIDRICCGSFSDRRLRTVRKELGPQLCTGMGNWTVARIRLASWLHLKLLGRTEAACSQVPTKEKIVPIADQRFIRFAHSIDVPVQIWTIDDAAEMNRLLDLGADGIMTDKPSVLKDVLMQRGQWVV